MSEILIALCLSSLDVYFCVVIYFVVIIRKKMLPNKCKRKGLQCSMAVSEVFLHHALFCCHMNLTIMVVSID